MRFLKRGEIGIGSIVILITVLLVVLIFAAIYLSSVNKLQTQSYKATSKTAEFVSTKVQASEPISEFENGALKNFKIILKLTSGSESVGLDSLVISITTEDERTNLRFAGSSAPNTHSYDGYYSLGVETYDVPSNLDDDIDMDGVQDLLFINVTNDAATINISSAGTLNLGNCSDPTTFSKFGLSSDLVNDVDGACVGGTVVNVTITPTLKGMGLFSGEYLMQSESTLDGYLTKNDLFKAYFETQDGLGFEVRTTIDVIPLGGSPTPLMFITPDKESVGQIYLSHY